MTREQENIIHNTNALLDYGTAPAAWLALMMAREQVLAGAKSRDKRCWSPEWTALFVRFHPILEAIRWLRPGRYRRAPKSAAGCMLALVRAGYPLRRSP